MAKRRPKVTEQSHGLYDRFEPDGDALPRLTAPATRVPANPGQEFGYVLHIQHARGMLIRFEIAHPDIPGEGGAPRPPFEGDLYVRTSDFHFFLGDALWEPMRDMIGPWTLTTWLDDQQIAQRTFIVEPAGVDWDQLGEQ